jgi:predicted dehydrogenase
MAKAVRVGVLGLRRGAALARLARQAGMQVVAVRERDDRRREEAAAVLGAAGYRDVEAFLAHAMDAVILVNDFDQHARSRSAPWSKALSVLSETAACRTLAEGVAMIEAAERSSGIYMFAENYPCMPFTREMRRRYAAGDIGEVRYAEAEYLDEPPTSPGSLMTGPIGGPHPGHLLLHPLPGPGRRHHRHPASASQRLCGPTASGPESLERPARAEAGPRC